MRGVFIAEIDMKQMYVRNIYTFGKSMNFTLRLFLICNYNSFVQQATTTPFFLILYQ